jgi:hypothetical protein
MRNSNITKIDLADIQINSGSKIAVFVHWSKTDVISNHDQELINSLALEFDQLIVMRNLNSSSSINKNDNCKFKQNIMEQLEIPPTLETRLND